MTVNTLTITQVAKAAGITRPTFYSWWKDGKIPFTPIEGSKPPRWPSNKVCDWLGIDEAQLTTRLGG